MTTEREERLRRLESKLASRGAFGDPTARIVMPATNPDLAGAMMSYIESRRIPWSVMLFNGWYPTTKAIDTCPRVVVPCTEISRGRFWQARYLPLGGPGRPQDETSCRRWQSPYGDREDTVCMVYSPIKQRRGLFVAEGPFDAAAAAGLGMDAVALLGNTPNQAAIDHLGQIMIEYEYTLFMADANSLDKWEVLMRQYSSRYRTVLHSSAPWIDFAAAPDEGRLRLLEAVN